MAELPSDRLIPDEHLFSYVGIDFFDPLYPLYVKQGRSTVKHYGCLFSCLTMQATYTEGLNLLKQIYLLTLFAGSLTEEECQRL